MQQLFEGNRINIESILLKDRGLNYIGQIKNSLINEIYKNERIDDFCKNKIIKEIKTISNDNEMFKIENLKILLVGRTGIGKTQLIKYMLELSDDDIRDDNKKRNVKIYKSKRVKYLKLIEVKGIGFDKDSNPENIQKKIKEYIDDKNNQKFENVVHCIWYCFSGTRFENDEKSLFLSLKKMYKDNTIPIILVFTKSTDKKLVQEMRQNLLKDQINNDFIEVMAKQMNLTDGGIKKAFGKKELIKTTLIKSKEAFKSDMMKILIQKISNDITQNFLNKSEKTMEKIKQKTFNDFVKYYIKPLNDRDFIQYINDIFFKYLNNFLDNEKNITNKSRNLFFKSNFISSITKMYLSYKDIIKENINSLLEEKAKELLDLQANLEIKYGNMNINYRRNLDEFKETIEIFLKRNYYFIIQNYIIYFIINIRVNDGNYFDNFLSEIYDKIKESFISLGNLFDNSQYSTNIRNYLIYCLNKKLTYFSKENNLYYINDEKEEQQEERITFINQINF